MQTLDDIEEMMQKGDGAGIDPELVERLRYLCGTTARYLKLV